MWSFNLRWCLILTPSNLKVETCSNWWFPMQIAWIILLGYFMKFISISLLFSGFNFILGSIKKLCVSLTAKFKMLIELCSRSSKTVVLSTPLYFTPSRVYLSYNWEQGNAHLSPLGYAIMGVFTLRQGIIYTHSFGSISQKRLSNQIEQGPHQGVRVRPQVYGDLSYQIPLKSLKRRFRHRNFSNW